MSLSHGRKGWGVGVGVGGGGPIPVSGENVIVRGERDRRCGGRKTVERSAGPTGLSVHKDLKGA